MSSITQLLITDQQKSAIGMAGAHKGLSAFTPFGYVRRNTPYRSQFNGEPYDKFTQRYLLGNGYRAYSPSLMRFLSSDSFSPFGLGGINSYAYCSGDPINAIDPSGHTRFSPLQVKAKNSPLLELTKLAPNHKNANIIKNNLHNSKVIRAQLMEDSNLQAEWITFNAQDAIPTGLDVTKLHLAARDRARHKALAKILHLEPKNKPAVLTLIELAIDTTPGRRLKDPTIAMDSLSDILGISYKKIPKNALKRLGEMSITAGKKSPSLHGYYGWVEESQGRINAIRTGLGYID